MGAGGEQREEDSYPRQAGELWATSFEDELEEFVLKPKTWVFLEHITHLPSRL